MTRDSRPFGHAKEKCRLREASFAVGLIAARPPIDFAPPDFEKQLTIDLVL
jgi:hypothetical protein